MDVNFGTKSSLTQNFQKSFCNTFTCFKYVLFGYSFWISAVFSCPKTLLIVQHMLDKLKMQSRGKLHSWAAECIQCKLSFNTTKDLKTHILQHDGKKPHSCNLCGYSTIKANHLKRHMMVHSGEKPFACTQCNYSCTQAGTLKSHMLTHTGETSFSCAQWRQI